MSKIIVPKISINHQSSSLEIDDYILGKINNDTFDVLEFLLYKQNKNKTQFIDKTNHIGTNGFAFISECFKSGDYYLTNNQARNSIVGAILSVISPRFSLLKSPEEINQFVDNFSRQIGIDLDEKQLFKKLDLSAYKLRRKKLQESLFENSRKIEDWLEVCKYICVRFKIGLLIVHSDKKFMEICKFPGRLTMILLEKGEKYLVMNNKNMGTTLFEENIVDTLVKYLVNQNIPKLNDIKQYMVDDLKNMVSKLGLNPKSKTKAQLYELIRGYKE